MIIYKGKRSSLIHTASLLLPDFLSDEMRVAMEQNYAYRPSEAAPMSAAPPVDYPREAFGTRSSMDLTRPTNDNGETGGRPHSSSYNGTAELPLRMKNLSSSDKANGSGENKVLFQVDEGREVEDDEADDWGNSDEEDKGKKSTAATGSHSGR